MVASTSPVKNLADQSCSGKVRDSSLTRKFKCVCVIRVAGPVLG